MANVSRGTSVSPTRNPKKSSGNRAASSLDNSSHRPRQTHKLKGDKLIFLNQVTGDTVISSNPCPRQNCVCTICTCGNHHCPHVWNMSHHPVEKSEYQERYIEPLPGFKRDLVKRVDLPAFQDKLPADHFVTTHAKSYVPLDLPNNDRKIRGVPFSGTVTVTPFDGTSTHRAMYTGKQPDEKRKSYKPMGSAGDDSEFKGISLSHSDMQNWFDNGTNFRVPRTERKADMLPSHPFTATTTHRTAFIAPPPDFTPATACDPRDALPSPSDPFSHITEYDLQYTEKELLLCPVPGLAPKNPSQLTGHVHYLKSKTGAANDPAAYRPATVRLGTKLKSLPKIN